MSQVKNLNVKKNWRKNILRWFIKKTKEKNRTDGHKNDLRINNKLEFFGSSQEYYVYAIDIVAERLSKITWYTLWARGHMIKIVGNGLNS